ncbi:MAG: acyl-CoA dehydrogenase family protein [Methylovirgula sp.]
MTVQGAYRIGKDPATGVKGSIAARIAAVAQTAADDAPAVDMEARFPRAAINAVRENCLLSLMVPQDLGGESAALTDIADACYQLGQACSATAMIFAMHHSAAACVIRHAGASAWHRDLLRQVADKQLLFASSNH